jgi:hypothetical protein
MKTKLTRLAVSAGLAVLYMMAACLLVAFFGSVILFIVSLLPIGADATDVAKWGTILCFVIAFALITYGIYKNKP